MKQRNIARNFNINITTEEHNNQDLSFTHILPHNQSIKIYHQIISSLRNKMNELLCHLHNGPPYTWCLPDQLHHDELSSLHIENYKLKR